MRRTPTLAEAERIAAIVSDVVVTYRPDHFDWKGHKAEAFDICKLLSGYKPSKACFSCWIRVLNILREAINLEPIDHGADEQTAARRMEICRACPAFHENTVSCGRLLLDAINPHPVTVDGQQVNPCGCSLVLKTKLKRAHCPANKW
jgi:hypothetical protein